VLRVPDTVLFDLRGTLLDPSTGWRLSDAQRIRFLRACGASATEAQLRVNLERAIADVNALTFDGASISSRTGWCSSVLPPCRGSRFPM
jgi:phosphoglycolate phosphatase-like HAD superfamily hydrolase